MSVVIPRY